MSKTTKRNGGTVYTEFGYRGHKIRMNNYEQAKARYEMVAPIKGIRGKLGGDIRPVTDRYRTWEVFMKDGDNYGVGFYSTYIDYDHVKQEDGSTKSIPKSLHGTPRPLLMFSPDNVVTYTPQWSSSYTTWDFLAGALPNGMHFTKYGAKQYMELQQPDGSYQYFLLPTHGSVRFVPYEIEDNRFYRVHAEDIVREQRYLIDREKSKRMTEEFKAFVDYYRIMGDLLTVGIDPEEINWREREEAKQTLYKNNWLWRRDGEEYGSKWADAVTAFFRLDTQIRHTWNHETATWGAKLIGYCTADDVQNMPRARLIKMARPYRSISVPVGVGFRPDGRHL